MWRMRLTAGLRRRLFISYRRSDAAAWAGRLRDSLERRYGARSVFMDVESLEGGQAYRDEILKTIVRCDVVLVVIGPTWAGTTSATGQLRLSEEEDLVRTEIVAALQQSVPTIPVLVGGATMPTIAQLPVTLRPLVERHAVVLRDEHWRHDIRRLTRALGKSWHRLAVAALGVALVAVAALVLTRDTAPGLPEGEYICSAGTRTLPRCRIDRDGREVRLSFVGSRHQDGELIDRYTGTMQRAGKRFFVTVRNDFNPEPAGGAADVVALSSLTLTPLDDERISGTWTFANRSTLPFEMRRK